MEPLVTVGICVRNGEKTLHNAVNSLLEQNYPLECIQTIFIDDGSRDRTPQIISEYLPALGPQSKSIQSSWKGLGQARQAVVDNASGKYLAWLDCDMTLANDFIRKQVAFMEANPEVGIGKAMYGVNKNERLVAALENIEFLVDLPGEVTAASKSLGTGGSIYRLDALRQAGGFDTGIKGAGEDTDVEYRIRTKGWRLYITDAVFYEKRRETWRGLWDEYFWRGASWQLLVNKNREMVNLSKMLPPVALLMEVLKVPTAYKLTGQKKAVFLPVHYVFKRVAWFLGFINNRK